jgi:hypothetical protein
MIWHKEEWQRGTVDAILARPRSYRVTITESGQTLERNRVLLRKVPGDTTQESVKKANPFPVFLQALEVPPNPLNPTLAGPEEDVHHDDDLATDPDHDEFQDFSESENDNEYESDSEEAEETTDGEEDEDDEDTAGRGRTTPPSHVTRTGRPVRPPRRYTPPPR